MDDRNRTSHLLSLLFSCLGLVSLFSSRPSRSRLLVSRGRRTRLVDTASRTCLLDRPFPLRRRSPDDRRPAFPDGPGDSPLRPSPARALSAHAWSLRAQEGVRPSSAFSRAVATTPSIGGEPSVGDRPNTRAGASKTPGGVHHWRRRVDRPCQVSMAHLTPRLGQSWIDTNPKPVGARRAHGTTEKNLTIVGCAALHLATVRQQYIELREPETEL